MVVAASSSCIAEPLAPIGPNLTDQHKWELLTAIAECMQKVLEEEAPSPEDCRSSEGARASAAGVLDAVKAACIAELAEGISLELAARLQHVLPPIHTNGGDGEAEIADLTEVEKDIHFAFQHTTRELVMDFIKNQRRLL